MATTTTFTMTSTSNSKSVIVTGGASGIGLAMTRHFASQGHRVAIFDVNAQSGETSASQVAAEYPQATITFKKCDVSSWEELSAAFKEIYLGAGRIDVVMANAGITGASGIGHDMAAEDEPLKPSTRTLDVNLVSVIYSVKLAMHYMQKNEPDPATGSRGLIVCTASASGLYPFPMAPMYSISKCGVIGLVRSMAGVLGKVGIQINGLAPALVETNIFPSKDAIEGMVMTPVSTVIRAVGQFIENSKLTGEIAEVHGESVTLRPPHEYVDKDTRDNMEKFGTLYTAQGMV